MKLLRRAFRRRSPAPRERARPARFGEHTPSSVPVFDPRLPPMMEQVAARLEHVCAHLEPELFRALVRRIARFKLRWAESPAKKP